ncbi:hypothetical protein DSO57_1030799 [Entomophthora muscae]|uniref:Uncharacterized protein n=1 Tax=Entomophthora muscae TaxID=34485 RepID=A0ACC2RRW1_9FUNG|nr:hypothetical protein DSO57_1030799 [Entomophthora muscae]
MDDGSDTIDRIIHPDLGEWQKSQDKINKPQKKPQKQKKASQDPTPQAPPKVLPSMTLSYGKAANAKVTPYLFLARGPTKTWKPISLKLNLRNSEPRTAPFQEYKVVPGTP